MIALLKANVLNPRLLPALQCLRREVLQLRVVGLDGQWHALRNRAVLVRSVDQAAPILLAECLARRWRVGLPVLNEDVEQRSVDICTEKQVQLISQRCVQGTCCVSARTLELL